MPLESWDVVRQKGPFKNLLIGNGASCAVSRCFRYDSLYDVATERALFDPRDLPLFDVFATSNFEVVLGHLSNARRVLQSLGKETRELDARYQSVARTLARAVASTHVKWKTCEGVLGELQNGLRAYCRVFSTNFDLLAYWAYMAGDNPAGFRDLFFDGENFNATNTGIKLGCPGIFFLHGALHLRQTAEGRTIKRAQSGATLLEHFEEDEVDHPADIPLIITGGDADEKLRAIQSSDYLAHCYKRLGLVSEGLCVFGHAFAAQDSHIIACLKDNPNLHALAVSVYTPGCSPQQIGETVAHLEACFEPKKVYCFDAATHPLGAATLSVG